MTVKVPNVADGGKSFPPAPHLPHCQRPTAHFPLPSSPLLSPARRPDLSDDYIVIVFGDSGNASPKFRITGHKNATTATTGMADTAGKIEKEIANLITGDQKAQKDKESKNKKTTSGNAAVKRHARRHFQA